MTLKRYKVASNKRAEPALLLPPNLRTLGTLSFTQTDRDTLHAWLAEDGWPRGRMDIAMLEGYLVALLVWPVGVPPGAWLPPIWAERGWKVPAKIASPDAYAKFTGLVVGFLQELDRGLGARPPRFVPTLSTIESPLLSGRSPSGSSWAQGFLRALQQNLQGLAWRSTMARSAVASIARHASLAAPAAGAHPAVAEDLTSAVLTLVVERLTRGPLGTLESGKSDPAVPNACAPYSSGTSAHGPGRHD